MKKDEVLRRPTLKVYRNTKHGIDIEVKVIEDDVIWYTSMSWKGPKAHSAKIYTNSDTNAKSFQAEGHKISLDCLVDVPSTADE